MADINELAQQGGQLLTFISDGRDMAFQIMDVTDIIEVPELTVIPTAPDHILGLMNLRGKAVPVMDLRLRLGYPKGEYDERSCVIIIEINTNQCGILVDRVRDVERITPDMVALSPAQGGVVSAYVTLGEDKPRISVLDTERLVRTRLREV
ncbi:MAG: purine-binding chemotaxis protein CheW [Ruminococcus sp.]|nr:purine-binding chemotaxis protein CheW [Ruminococcus sp.]